MHFRQASEQRRSSEASTCSLQSQFSHGSDSLELDEESIQREPCLVPGCGRDFKDLKAHMLSHQEERPEKCPVTTCEYHVRGFARKYDKNRHTINHYKGIMICGFCPTFGSTVQESFNRVESFKAHLNHAHGVESRLLKSQSKTSKNRFEAADSKLTTCDTCSIVFSDIQVFYDHIDDCVLNAVLHVDPCEAINQKNLELVMGNAEVQETLNRHNLSSNFRFSSLMSSENATEDDDMQRQGEVGDAKEEFDSHMQGYSSQFDLLHRGLTFSKGGVPSEDSAPCRKKRGTFPPNWACSNKDMNMKKRVLCVYDGQRRLWKDDMKLSANVGVKCLSDDQDDPTSRTFVSDLDMQTIRRSEALHGATEEERGEWIPDNLLPYSRKLYGQR
jgi:hypothetical protein